MSIPSGFLLSQVNPIANSDQCAAEETALRILQLPVYKEARQKAAFLWRLAYGEDVRGEALPSFDAAMDEYAFNYLLKAVASDENYPRLVRDFMPPHQWFERWVPGARMGGDNPDNCYRVGGVSYGPRYEVHGQALGTAAACVTFTLVANYGTSVTIETLEFSDVDCDADGSFTLSIDLNPAEGRRNHLRSAPGCKFLFVRDSMADWGKETPLALSLRRVDPADADPLTDQQLAERAAHRMIEEVPLYYWFTRLFSGKPVNTCQLHSSSGSVGGLVTQAGAQGRVRLRDNEAAVVTVDPAGAKYSGIVLMDWWFRSLSYWDHTASMTNPVSKPEPDGRVTYVISLKDPGVHNWIDTCGLHETLVLYRWQALPANPVRQGPVVDPVRVVKMKDLEKALPRDTVTVTPMERARQVEERTAAFARRVVDR